MKIKIVIEYEYEVDTRAYLKHVNMSEILEIEANSMSNKLHKFADIIHRESPHLKINDISMALTDNFDNR